MYFAFLCFLYCTFKSTRCMDGFYDKDMASKEQSDPMYKIITEEFVEKPWVEYRDNIEKEKKKNPENWKQHYSHNLIEIPVVIHVIYEPEELIIGSEQIQSAFRELNDAFFDINYYNKEEIEEFAIYRGNFSMQFKLSTVKYIDGTGEDSGADDGWEEEQAVNLSPADDQNHYLHFYIVSSVAGGAYGSSSFPTLPLKLRDCQIGFGWFEDGDDCLQNSFFAKMKLIGDDENKCLEIFPKLPMFMPFREVYENNCIYYFNDWLNKIMTPFMGVTLDSLPDGADGDHCIKLHENLCDKFLSDSWDPIQIIRFQNDWFGLPDDNKRGEMKLSVDIKKGIVAHEVGHWVGLRHIFSDVGKCASGDYVVDTDVQQEAYRFICPSQATAHSCNSTDMYNNIMDYSNCNDIYYMFTKGQVDRGRYFFENNALRHSFMDYRPHIVKKFISSIYFIIEDRIVTKNPCHSYDLWIQQDIKAGMDRVNYSKRYNVKYMCTTY
eukprot:964067_1